MGRWVSRPIVLDKHIVRIIPEEDSWLTSETIEVEYITLNLYIDKLAKRDGINDDLSELDILYIYDVVDWME